jgi:hypothetical protein
VLVIAMDRVTLRTKVRSANPSIKKISRINTMTSSADTVSFISILS